MAERPLLILPKPAHAPEGLRRFGGGAKLHRPSFERQKKRLERRFEQLQQAMDERRARLQIEAVGLVPEEVIVLETAAPIENFIAAVRKIDGMEWLGEIAEDDIPPDDDFFALDKKGQRRDERALSGRVFFVFTNQQALQQLLSLWNRWKSEKQLPHGFAKWKELFSLLRDVRPWGIRDRLLETGVLDDWRERVAHNEESVPVEIELWFRGDTHKRRAAQERVEGFITGQGGHLVAQATIEEIAYHVLLARLPIAAVHPILHNPNADVALIQCEQIQFFRVTGQMAGIVPEGISVPIAAPFPEVHGPLKDPVVALLDGLPLQNHGALAGRLTIDDPDGFEVNYPARERRHGTAMASLILHGELDRDELPLDRRLYVRPILRPDDKDWRTSKNEVLPENTLAVDLVHRAVRRMLEGEGEEPATAPSVRVINLSIGIKDRPFDGAMSPLARLLDWLAWEYKILFVVSAGNHLQDIQLDVSQDQFRVLPPKELQRKVLQSLAADARNRRLLSPAEGINVLTIGACDEDASNGQGPPQTIRPYLDEGLPSPINAQGMGYRKGIKPEIFGPGGRVMLRESLTANFSVRLEVVLGTHPPGQKVAAPGDLPGQLAHSTFTRGTSNATALLSRAAAQLHDTVDELREEPGGELIDAIPRAVWLKALLTHASYWGQAGEILDDTLRTPANSRKFKEYLTRLIGYGRVDFDRVRECTERRVTTLGGGSLEAGQAHVHRFPLPPSLGGKQGQRRLVITLAWFTPINPQHQGYRRADLWFTPPPTPLDIKRQDADWRAVQRGTIQHETLEGSHASAFVDGDQLEIHVGCRADAGSLEQPVPYALVVTLEVAEELGIEIYEEVRARVQARVRVAPPA